ncbi:hypothetical protein BDW59DRAFT_165819 [Aspergillus cavernicola]|uniref:F-box domain-containing protein n=1 Tax=Aspergillus cavernicola TaxID=176166 RepID=A0ABR4HSF2_9EURO
MSLLHLPNEILLLIFHQTASIQDACSLAQTCSQLHGLFSRPSSKIAILQSAANVPRRPKYRPENDSSVIVRIPPHSWAFQSSRSPKRGLLIEADYGPLSEGMIESAMWNLGIIRSRQTEDHTFNEALHDFLSQFDELDQRWKGYFESATEDILKHAAQLQLDILRKSVPPIVPTDLSGETTVIALALHLLLITVEISVIEGWTVHRTEEQLFDDGSPAHLLDAGYEYDRFIPSVRIYEKDEQEWKELCRAKDNQTPGYSLDAGPDVILEYIIQLSFRLLDTQDPRHWPTVLFVLLILYLTVPDLKPYQPWMQEFKHASEPLFPLLKDLARYYYISAVADSNNWTIADYATRVAHDEGSITWARWLSRLWLETNDGVWETRDVERGIDGFPDKLDFFAHGCAL